VRNLEPFLTSTTVFYNNCPKFHEVFRPPTTTTTTTTTTGGYCKSLRRGTTFAEVILHSGVMPHFDDLVMMKHFAIAHYIVLFHLYFYYICKI
jgi:hypothetical protein